ncbi:MAG: PepSY domain-containing protein [Planctomycetaceae bacterium]|nr:PepSY domain-containing protein [Planctomycetaceae bacterium]
MNSPQPPAPTGTDEPKSRVAVNDEAGGSRRSRRLSTRMLVVLRRVHMYAGLFLLPWVFLYGITGAMFNHYGLFTDAQIVSSSPGLLAETAMEQFPTTDALADDVVRALQAASPGIRIERDPSSPAEFVNDIVLQVTNDEIRHAVYINPVDHSSWVSTTERGQFGENDLLPDVDHVSLDNSPYEMARQSVPTVVKEAGLEMVGEVRPFGWCKLNFLARVDGRPARITYVLRDGHVDVAEYTGEPPMTMRSLFLRLHTTHGQPPHWNGRMIWSLFADIMAAAMVLWGISGVVMWWQIKRTRVLGGFVLLASVGTGAAVYLSVVHFYATTRL